MNTNELINRLHEVEKNVSKSYHQTIEKIKRVPHLLCDLSWDVERALEEVKKLSNWSPHKLHPYKNLSAAYLDKHEKNFVGVCLVDYQKNSLLGMLDSQGSLYRQPEAQIDEKGRLQYFLTDAGEQTPYIISQLRKISPNINRTRVIRTPPGGGIPWHSHHNNVYKIDYLRLCIFNIPLITHERCIHSVRDHRDVNSRVYSQHYQKGQTYLFNSWHDHEFMNYSPIERITIIPYFNFTDEVLLNFIEDNLQRYNGPWLNE